MVEIKKFEGFHDNTTEYSDYVKSLSYEDIYEIFKKSFEFYEHATDIMTTYQLEWINSSIRSLVLHTYRQSKVMDIGVEKLAGAAIYEIEVCSENIYRLVDMYRTLEQLERFSKLGKHTRKDDLELLINSEIVDEINVPMKLISMRNMYLQHEDTREYFVAYEVNFRFNNQKYKGSEIEKFLETKRDYFESMGFEFNDISAGIISTNRVGKYEIYILDTEDIIG